MGIDEDAIAFRQWKPSVEARLAALEAGGTQSTITANVAMSPEFQKELDDLKAALAAVPSPGPELEALKTAVSTLGERLTAVEAQTTESSTVLAGVEAALGAHSHPTLAPAEHAPAEPAAAPGA
jgi:hypothetical protein